MLENTIFTLQMWGAPKLLNVFGKKSARKNHLWFACFGHSLFRVKSQNRKIQWIKHLRIWRIRGIACSCGNYFVSRREISSQSMWLKDASSNTECSFLLLQLKPGQTTLAISENNGIGPVPTEVSCCGWEDLGGRFTISIGRSKKYKRWSLHQRWGNMLHFPFVADTVLWLALKAHSCLGWSLSTALTRVENSYHVCYIHNGKEPQKGAVEENIWLI